MISISGLLFKTTVKNTSSIVLYINNTIIGKCIKYFYQKGGKTVVLFFRLYLIKAHEAGFAMRYSIYLATCKKRNQIT